MSFSMIGLEGHDSQIKGTSSQKDTDCGVSCLALLVSRSDGTEHKPNLQKKSGERRVMADRNASTVFQPSSKTFL